MGKTYQVYTDGSVPEKLFWRIKIDDTNSDTDTLSDWEKDQLGLNPFS